MKFLNWKGVLAAALLALATGAWQPVEAQQVPPTTPKRMNVLFIAIDDLRPQIGAYGVSDIQTPHMDRLAAQGTLFLRAYCQQAVCSPSRTSLLTGRRPDTTKIYDLKTHFRKNLPDVVTLPQYFKQNGYHAQGFGKVFHIGDKPSWSVPSTDFNSRAVPQPAPGKEGSGQTTGTIPAAVASPQTSPAWAAPDVPDNALSDGKLAEAAIAVLREKRSKPFFLAVGFHKPHLPFIAPKRYYDRYPPEKMRLAPNPKAPQNVPSFALSDWGELRNWNDIPKTGPLPEEKARELVRGYYASTTYVDAQVGKLLDELDKQGLRENTIVILWGDHGWQLGEHGLWSKHTNFEVAARAPLLLFLPGQKRKGAKTKALVEFVDIYPTLCEAAGLPLPDGLEGVSLRPLLDDPNLPWKTAAFSQFPRGVPGGGGSRQNFADNNQRVMGHSMRTDQYRFTEWRTLGSKELKATELYDHKSDPGENINIAALPQNKTLVEALSKQLNGGAGWRNALPPAASRAASRK